MTKPIGATQQQLDEHNIEWVLCGNYGHRDTQEPQWALRHSSEYEWAKEREILLQEIANLTKDAKHLAACLDPFVEHDETVKIMNKYFIPWPDPLDHSDKDSKEKSDQKFKDGIRYFQG